MTTTINTTSTTTSKASVSKISRWIENEINNLAFYEENIHRLASILAEAEDDEAQHEMDFFQDEKRCALRAMELVMDGDKDMIRMLGLDE